MLTFNLIKEGTCKGNSRQATLFSVLLTSPHRQAGKEKAFSSIFFSWQSYYRHFQIWIYIFLYDICFYLATTLRLRPFPSETLSREAKAKVFYCCYTSLTVILITFSKLKESFPGSFKESMDVVCLGQGGGGGQLLRWKCSGPFRHGVRSDSQPVLEETIFHYVTFQQIQFSVK